mmetsp:Transcript_34639/g.42356  ORF Transcript_34639/g.42356 Transcript_34639/m.42356 type:complete len:322 (-) Transcript_34639:75-1040(-)
MIGLTITRTTPDCKRISIRLFDDDCPGGAIPVKTEHFHPFEEYGDLYIEVIESARKYYRAIGRIMLRSLLTNHPISPEAMPSFFRNIIFRDVGPQENPFRDDILEHLSDIGAEMNVEGWIGQPIDYLLSDDDMELITAENFFTKVIPGYFVDSRRLAIDSIVEGLTLNGTVELQALFHSMPLHIVSELAFLKPNLEAEDVIKALEPKYFGGEVLKEIQKDFFEGPFIEFMKEQENKDDFLSKFVHFCTGLYFLPDHRAQPSFKIVVEFNEDNDLGYGALPKAHTCENTLVLPRDAYDGSKETLEEKLGKAIAFTSASFGMR